MEEVIEINKDKKNSNYNDHDPSERHGKHVRQIHLDMEAC